MTRKRARLYGVLLLLLGVGVAAGLALTAMKDSVSYFRTPTQIISEQHPERMRGHGLRLGGLVEKGSVKHDGAVVTFRVTDMTNSMPVRFEGLLPDLFRENQGVIAEGKMGADGVFAADRILAKHDEKYMPPELSALKPQKP